MSSGRGQAALRLVAVVALAFGLATLGGYLYSRATSAPRLEERGSRHVPTGGPLPAAGARVPVYDLFSDPVFPTLRVGYAIERHETAAGTTEGLARSEDAGHSWFLVGPFPFSNGYDEVQFISVQTGYAFGPAGLALTRDGGRVWVEAAPLGGTLERVIPIGANVWATYLVCNGPPVPTTPCSVRLAVSSDGGLTWSRAATVPHLPEGYGGGDILARVDLVEAYVVSYGPTGGGLALTDDDGASWTRLPDPCSSWRVVDMAALWSGNLWMICGGAPVPGADASAKAVFRSKDGGMKWVPVAYTGFGPSTGALGASGPIGEIDYAGQLSQLATISLTRAWIGVSGVGVLVTTDSGRIWTLAAGIPPRSGTEGVGVTFDDATDGWAIEFRAGVYRTTNAVTWRAVAGH